MANARRDPFPSPSVSAHLLYTKKQRDLKPGCPLIRTAYRASFQLPVWHYPTCWHWLRPQEARGALMWLPTSSVRPALGQNPKAGAICAERGGGAGNTVLGSEPWFGSAALVRSVCCRNAESPPASPAARPPRAHAAPPGWAARRGSPPSRGRGGPTTLRRPSEATDTSGVLERPAAEPKLLFSGLDPPPALRDAEGLRVPALRLSQGRGGTSPPTPRAEGTRSAAPGKPPSLSSPPHQPGPPRQGPGPHSPEAPGVAGGLSPARGRAWHFAPCNRVAPSRPAPLHRERAVTWPEGARPRPLTWHERGRRRRARDGGSVGQKFIRKKIVFVSASVNGRAGTVPAPGERLRLEIDLSCSRLSKASERSNLFAKRFKM